MEQLTVALDVEGVLADSHAAAVERSDMLTAENTPPQQYSFESEELLDEYMHVSSNVWHNHNHEIPPVEDELWKATRTINRLHDVDIITARIGQDAKVREWLEGYNIEYDTFTSTDSPSADKTEYGTHDVHVEDSPHVTRDALDVGRDVILVRRPYNEGVRSLDGVWPVSGVSEAAQLLSDPSVVSELSRF